MADDPPHMASFSHYSFDFTRLDGLQSQLKADILIEINRIQSVSIMLLPAEGM
jgi:hypothetical protein